VQDLLRLTRTRSVRRFDEVNIWLRESNFSEELGRGLAAIKPEDAEKRAMGAHFGEA